jgi:hypothetical protein
MTAALDLMAGELIVVCETGGGEGYVARIEDEDDAEAACSPGLFPETPPPGGSEDKGPPGRVVRVVQLP